VLNAPLPGLINIHMRGGYIIPKADDYSIAMTVQQLRNSTVTLVVALSGQGLATGNMVLDDGLSPNTIQTNNYTYMNYMYKQTSANAGILTFTASMSNYVKAPGEYPGVSNVVIYGCKKAITSVTLKTQNVMDNGGFDQYGSVCWASIVNVAPDDVVQLNFSFN